MRCKVILTAVLMFNIVSLQLPQRPGNSTGRACWHDGDCVLYPLCKRPPSSCRCLPSGVCLLVRGYGQKCSGDETCAEAMRCVSSGLNNSGNGQRICKCGPGARFSPYLGQCFQFSGLSVPPVIDPPRFADLPDREDADAPEEIPATYSGAILVGMLSLGLVALCLCLTTWCHYTSSQLRAQQEQPHLFPARYDDDAGGESEKIPLDMFVPPPAMYRTPGYHNIGVGSEDHDPGSETKESLVSMGSELSHTLR